MKNRLGSEVSLESYAKELRKQTRRSRTDCKSADIGCTNQSRAIWQADGIGYAAREQVQVNFGDLGHCKSLISPEPSQAVCLRIVHIVAGKRGPFPLSHITPRCSEWKGGRHTLPLVDTSGYRPSATICLRLKPGSLACCHLNITDNCLSFLKH